MNELAQGMMMLSVVAAICGSYYAALSGIRCWELVGGVWRREGKRDSEVTSGGYVMSGGGIAVCLLAAGLAGIISIGCGLEPVCWSVVVVCVTFLIGLIIVRQVMQMTRVRRAKALDDQLLDVMAVFRNGLHGSRGILQCLELVVSDVKGPVGDDFAAMLVQHKMGKDIVECTEEMMARVKNEDLNLILTGLQVSQRVGGNLSKLMESAEKVIRSRRKLRERVVVLTAQARFEGSVMAIAPFAICGVLYVLDSAYITPLFTTRVGLCALGVVVVFEVAAHLMVRRIATVEV